MANTALNAPAHRIARRLPIGNASAPNWAPSVDLAGSGIQDIRLPYNRAQSANGTQILGWYPGAPLIDSVPSTLTTTALAAAQVPVAGTALTLVSSTGAGITVSSSAFLFLASLVSVAAGSLFIDGLPGYNTFGTDNKTAFYDPTKMLARNVQIASVGNDSSATFLVSGYDIYGFAMSELITGANAGTASGIKAFKVVTSIVPAGTLSGSNVSAGQGDKYGLPIQAARSSMVSGFWNGIILNGVGTFVAGVTTTATTTTGDVRGTYTVGSASNNTKRLTLNVAPDLALLVSQGIQQGLTGVAQA